MVYFDYHGVSLGMREQDFYYRSQVKTLSQRAFIGEKIQFLFGMFILTVVPIIMIITEFGSLINFILFLKDALILIVFITILIACSSTKNKIHYTKPHRYIVENENNKNYKIKKGWNKTTYIAKK